MTVLRALTPFRNPLDPAELTMFLNASIPHFTCLLRAEYLYDLEAHHGDFVEVVVFGIASIPCRALMFHCLTDRGAQIARLPISAFVHREDAPDLPVDHLELWDSFSYEVAVTEFDFLTGLRCRTILKDGKWYEGEYLFTVDWCNSQASEDVGDLGHKNAHILELDCGCYAAQPNNRILWYEPSFITNPFGPGERPDYITNTHFWKCERKFKWATEDSDRFFYDTKDIPTSSESPPHA